jgi:hypothetical protein
MAITELRYGTYLMGELLITPHNCPDCLLSEEANDYICDDCDWVSPDECSLLIDLSIKQYIKRQYLSIREFEQIASLDLNRILNLAQQFLTNSTRPRHYAVIAYEINQDLINNKVGKTRVLYILRKHRELFTESKWGEFELRNH